MNDTDKAEGVDQRGVTERSVGDHEVRLREVLDAYPRGYSTDSSLSAHYLVKVRADDLAQLLGDVKAYRRTADIIAAAPKAPTTPDLAVKELVEAAQHSNDWLRGALDCKTWHWDGDQREMAESAHHETSRALAALGGDNPAEGVG